MTDERINTASRDWRIVEAWAQQRLSMWRAQLESQAADERTTAVLRGRIAELKALGELPNPPQPISDEDFEVAP